MIRMVICFWQLVKRAMDRLKSKKNIKVIMVAPSRACYVGVLNLKEKLQRIFELFEYVVCRCLGILTSVGRQSRIGSRKGRVL